MPDEDRRIEDSCRGVVAAGQGALKWEWDGRFRCALTVFGGDQIAQLSAALAPFLGASFDARTFGDAPQLVRDRLAGMGGLRGDQRLLVGADFGGAMLGAAWWPWGGGAKVSLRVFAVCAPESPLAATLQGDLRTWFGLA